jgi:hypothetical protein
MFNPWVYITKGTGRSDRIGDKISPVSMKIRLMLNNKNDHFNIAYRVIICRVPKSFAGVISTANNVNIFAQPQQGTVFPVNDILCPLDKDQVIKTYHDRVHHRTNPNSSSTKESKQLVKIWLKRQGGRAIVYDNVSQNIINNPLSMYVIPYDSYGTLVTDNISETSDNDSGDMQIGYLP